MTDRMRFEELIGAILQHEGGYVNDPVDPGGETKYGISKRSYPHLDIKSLTVSDAKDIYYRDWWLKLRCPEILSDRIAQKYLDMSINLGPYAGTRILQLALRCRGHAVVVDGLIGPKTLAAVNKADSGRLLDAIREGQAEYYRGLIRGNPKLAKFERGWMNRAAF